MMQETIGNILAGFLKTLKDADLNPELIEIRIKRLHQPVKVDAPHIPIAKRVPP
jgi:hypothetical protein